MNDTRFVYAGTSWDLNESDYFSYPLDISHIVAGDIRRTYHGTADKHVRFTRTNINLTWEHCGTTVKDITGSWVMGTGTVTLECYAGTWNCYALSQGYSTKNVSLDVWDVSLTLEEV